MHTLNSFHRNVNFTFEEEKDGKIPFLDALLVRKNKFLLTTVYWKGSYINLFLNWNLFGLKPWIYGTLITIVTRAFEICTSKNISRTGNRVYSDIIFHHNNDLFWLVEKFITEVKDRPKTTTVINDKKV